MASNLQAVLKSVERAGTSFQQRYWVSIDEVKTLVKENGWSKALGKMGGDVSTASHMFSSWTSSSTSPGGLKMQGAAAKMMGAKLSDYPVAKSDTKKDYLDAGYKSDEMCKTVVAMQAVTRAGLENDGYKPRTMYRGMAGEVSSAMIEAAKAQADAGVPYHEAAINITLNPASSFSESENLAEGFGSAVIALHEVPSHAYIGHYRVQGSGTVGYNKEKEGIVAFQGPHPIGVQDIRGGAANKIISYFKSKGLFDASKVDLDDYPPSKASNERVGKSIPKKAVDVQVPMIMKVPAGMDKNAMAEHLESSGAVVNKSATSPAGIVHVTVPSNKIGSFTEAFSKTPAFNSDLQKPATLKSYLEGKAKTLVGENEVPTFDGVSSTASTVSSKAPKAAKQYKSNLPSVQDLPDLPPEVASVPVQQKKGKGAVPEWAGKKTWRDLWVKWAKQEAVAAGHSPTAAKAKAQDAVNKANVDLKKFVHHASPSKAQFKAFFAKVVSGHVKK